MKILHVRHAIAAAATGVLLLAAAGCGGAEAPVDASGGSTLRPDFEPTAKAAKPGTVKGKRHKAHQREKQKNGETGRGDEDIPGQSGGSTTSATPVPAATTAPATRAAGPQVASVRDPSGDVTGSGGSAAFVDVTGATLTRTGQAWEISVTVAAALPARQDDDRIMNVVGFYDVDGDGSIDYETLAHLSDQGWGGSYRSPDGARFGSSSGVAVRVAGNRLVMSFPLSHLGTAKTLQWAVATQMGTYEQVTLGTTSTDHAPDSGAVAFPG